jgi:2-iminobutanoate/2-iminopropanoate deaminase
MEMERIAVLQRVNVEGIPRLPLFSHAVVAGDFIFVSGTLGLKPGTFELVEGGIGPQTVQALRSIENILAASGASLRDVVKINVYLADETTFGEMNKAYSSVLTGNETPARMTIGRAGLNFGAAIEIECTAYKRRK